MTVLLAVSGGVDSVALLRAMKALKTSGEGGLAAAHVNHRLRGEQSEADEAFVVDLCRRLDVPCEVHRVPTDRLAAQSGNGLEAAARSVRYDLLQQTAARLGARYVVTAHTADDQVETILHRILRGTGISGLAGMPRVRPLGPAATLIRPLLGFARAELAAYLGDVGQPYRTDPSNDDPRFTRNRIRHELLPLLAERFNPAVAEALLRLGALAAEVQAVVDPIVEGLTEQCVTEGPVEFERIRVNPLAGQPRYVVRQVLMAVWRRRAWPLQAMGFAQWDQLAEMIVAHNRGVETTPRKRVFPGSVVAEIRQNELWLERSAD
ncbi:MAG: tRNA lysidine(34) synthetase TilS [Planctomycetota bacterium]